MALTNRDLSAITQLMDVKFQPMDGQFEQMGELFGIYSI